MADMNDHYLHGLYGLRGPFWCYQVLYTASVQPANLFPEMMYEWQERVSKLRHYGGILRCHDHDFMVPQSDGNLSNLSTQWSYHYVSLILEYRV